MTIQIVAHDKGNDFLTRLSFYFFLFFSRRFFFSFFRLSRYLTDVRIRLQAWRLRPSSGFLHPSFPLLGYNCSRILRYSDAFLLSKYAKVVTNETKKKNYTQSNKFFFFSRQKKKKKRTQKRKLPEFLKKKESRERNSEFLFSKLNRSKKKKKRKVPLRFVRLTEWILFGSSWKLMQSFSRPFVLFFSYFTTIRCVFFSRVDIHLLFRTSQFRFVFFCHHSFLFILSSNERWRHSSWGTKSSFRKRKGRQREKKNVHLHT